MTTPFKRYAVASQCYHPTIHKFGGHRLEATVISARSNAEAVGFQIQELHKKFSDEDGWTNYTAIAVEIPDDNQRRDDATQTDYAGKCKRRPGNCPEAGG